MRLLNKVLLTLLFIFTFGLAVQAQTSTRSNAKLTIVVKEHGAEKSVTKKLVGLEARQFDVEEFLAENVDKADIKIAGTFINPFETIKLQFNSKDFAKGFSDLVFCEALVAQESTPFLGVRFTKNPNGAGALLKHVFEGSAADKAGLEVGDIIHLIDQETVNSGCDLKKYVLMQEVGDLVNIQTKEAGKAETVPTKLGYRQTRTISWEACKETSKTEASETSNSDLVLFPNPSNGIFQVQFNAANQSDINISITDIAGRQVFTQTVKGFKGAHTQAINISNAAAGVYVLTVQQGADVSTKKVVLEK